MLHECVEGLLLLVLEEAAVLLTKLVDHLSQEVESVVLVLGVFICASDNLDNLAHDIRLGQDLEESLVLAEVTKDGTGVESHVDIVLVPVGDLVEEGVDDHDALLLEDFLHLLLSGGELGLVGLLLNDVEIAVVRGVPLIFLLGLDLLLDKLDKEGSEGVLVQVTEKTSEDLALLMEQEILECHLLLFLEELLHDLKEVTAKDGLRIILFVEERDDGVEKAVVLLRELWLGSGISGLVLVEAASELGCGGLVGFTGLLAALFAFILDIL